jgi:DNA-binding MarR family transcriptional regulator
MGTPTITADAAQRRASELEELGKALRRVFAGLRRLRGRQARLGAQEVSHAQFELLLELLERGELQAGELAEAAQVTPATVSGMLDHLVDGGQVERLHHEHDRRVVVCRLTERGRREVKAFKARKKERWERALADVPEADLRAATRVLDRVGSFFEEP